MKLIVAIPAYRCADQIGRVLSDFDQELLQRIDRVIVIENCSNDGTLRSSIEAAQRLPVEKVCIFQNTKNFGLGGSQKMAINYARSENADYLAILHGDHQATTKDLHALIDMAERKPELGAIFGARFAMGSNRVGYSLIRTWGNFVLNAIYSLFTLRPITDMGSGLNLFKTEFFSSELYLDYSDAFTFNHDLLLDYCQRKVPFQFVPIHWSETDQRSNASTLKVGVKAATILLKWRFFGRSRSAEFGRGEYATNLTYPLER